MASSISPREFTETQLNKVGVTIVDVKTMKLKCRRCKETWKVNRKGLRLPIGYWKCPGGCNGTNK
ncbi:MAG TPA: hypothetical protein VIG62_08235 [Blastocatellia bacterium]|jgi:hypothetical protein